MKNKILTRKQAQEIDIKYVICQSPKAKYFILGDNGWTSFRSRRDAQVMLDYKQRG
jgi:hypothetical protein